MFWTSKENWIYPMTRHHAKPNNILLTKNLPFDSNIRQWNHLLMIPLHCLWAESNNRRRGQFECRMTWFCFCFDFVRSHAPLIRLFGLKSDVQSQVVGRILDVDGQGGGRSWKLDNSHGCHMCIIPYLILFKKQHFIFLFANFLESKII